MGLFENAQPTVFRKIKPETEFEKIPLNDWFDCKLTVYNSDEQLGSCSFRRYYLRSDIKYKNMYLDNARGRLFYKENWRNKPAIIVVSGSEGGLEKSQNIAQLLANRGFVTLAVAYFGLNELSLDLNHIPLEIIEDAILFLSELDYVDSRRIGIYGRSKGAEFALLAACQFPNLQAIVLNSPTDCVYEGIKGKLNSKCSSWTFQGVEVAYTPFRLRQYLSKLIFHNESLNKKTASLLPVEKISSPILLIASLQDEVWNSYEAACCIVRKLKSETKCNLILTPHLGHMNTISHQPNLRYKKMDYDSLQMETRKSWRATVQHFKKYL